MTRREMAAQARKRIRKDLIARGIDPNDKAAVEADSAEFYERIQRQAAEMRKFTPSPSIVKSI